jgi:hypothetical protein
MDAVFSPDGLHVATASMDGCVKFYELGREDDIDPRLTDGLRLFTLCFSDINFITGCNFVCTDPLNMLVLMFLCPNRSVEHGDGWLNMLANF